MLLLRLKVNEASSTESVMVGGHIDHLGFGNRGGTRAKGEQASKMHLGADDNASGIAAIMELAQFYVDQKKKGELNLKRDIIFGAWSGEEMGLFGSKHFIKKQKEEKKDKVYPSITAYFNLDMVGRLEGKPLTVHGTGSSVALSGIVDSLSEGFEVKKSDNPYLQPTLHLFIMLEFQYWHLFTGLHDDYHTPRDTTDKIDYIGLEKVSKYLRDITTATANLESAPDYIKVKR